VGERRRSGGEEGGVEVGRAHWPPFWMNDFTKSSALVSRTSSISSRIASMSSSSCSLRSVVASDGAASCATSSDSLERRGCFCSCAIVNSFVVPGPTLLGRGECADELLRRGAAVDQLTDVGAGPAQRVGGGDALQGRVPGEVEDHRVPRRGRDPVGVLVEA